MMAGRPLGACREGRRDFGQDFHYSYEADWRPYAFSEDESHLASEEELEERYTAAVLEAGGVIPAAGIPILSDGKRVVMKYGKRDEYCFSALPVPRNPVLLQLPLPASVPRRERV